MKVHGSCHCGAIVYEAVVDPQLAAVCHCSDCQTFSGAPFRASVPTKAEDFHLSQGRPKIYVKTADSGAKRAQAFCGDCGTPIYATDAENPRQFNLRLGAVTERAQIPPLRQVWCSSGLPWVLDVGNLPASPKG